MNRTTGMTIKAGDVAAISTSTGAITMPVWVEQLPQMLAPWAALAGFIVIVMTMVLKFYEIRAARIIAARAEEEFEPVPGD